MHLDLSKAVDLEYLEIAESRKLYSYGYNFHFYEIKAWPLNLKYLILSNYNYPLVGLPASLIYLQVPINYNHPLDNLPVGLICLKFPHKCEFNNSLDLLPVGLKSIEFCQLCAFDGELENLPPGLETLIMQINVENSCNLNALPRGLRFLVLRNWSFEYSLENIPASLEYLEIPMYTTSNIIKYFKTIELPATLRHLCLLTSSSLPHEDETNDDNADSADNIAYEDIYDVKIEKIQFRRNKVIQTLQEKYPGLIITTQQGGL
jgi:hypothetical protein